MNKDNANCAAVNEIYLSFLLNDKQFCSPHAEDVFNDKVSSINTDQYLLQINRSAAMAKAVEQYCNDNGYGKIIRAHWAAHPTLLSELIGTSIDSRSNPTDVLVVCENNVFGVSAKATNGYRDICFKNLGLGTFDKLLGLNCSSTINAQSNALCEQLSLPRSADDRKKYIRSTPPVQKQTNTRGLLLLEQCRDMIFDKLSTLSNDDIKTFLTTYVLNSDITHPPYVKCTCFGDMYVKIDMPDVNTLDGKITVEKCNGVTIGFRLNGNKFIQIRMKYVSEKLASSIKSIATYW